MEQTAKLFMILIGCRPDGRHVEQHDIFFSIAHHPADLVGPMINFWPEAKGNLHVDALREIRFVDGYEVRVQLNHPKLQSISGQENNLFFINLGGYKQNEFEEFHYKMVGVGTDKSEVIRQSKKTAFYRHTGFKGAPSHIDDKYGVDVDDVYKIADLLAPELKEKYTLSILPAENPGTDKIHLGYFKLDKLATYKW